MTKKQCAKCPWKVSTNPHEIPNGYSVDKHKNLADTIAVDTRITTNELKVMQCHESSSNSPIACIGWLHNQLGIGNNITLRMQCIANHELGKYELDGEQHLTFEDTLPE